MTELSSDPSFIWLHTAFYNHHTGRHWPLKVLIWSGWIQMSGGVTLHLAERGARAQLVRGCWETEGEVGGVNEQRKQEVSALSKALGELGGTATVRVLWEDLEHRQTGAHGRQTFRLPVEIPLGGGRKEGRLRRKGCSLDRNGNTAQDEACSAGQLQVYIPEQKLFPDKANSRSSGISMGHMNARAKGRGSSVVQIHLPEL